jgi:hypothetical protein
MKVTVITGARGKIIGAFHGHASDLDEIGRLSARPIPGPGQQFHEIKVPEDVFPVTIPPDELALLPKRLKTYLPRPPRRRAKRSNARMRSRT